MENSLLREAFFKINHDIKSLFLIINNIMRFRNMKM